MELRELTLLLMQTDLELTANDPTEVVVYREGKSTPYQGAVTRVEVVDGQVRIYTV